MSDWIIVYQSNVLNKAEIVKAVLTDHEIDAVIVNKMDTVNTHLTNAEVEVRVNNKDVIKAKHLITKHQL